MLVIPVICQPIRDFLSITPNSWAIPAPYSPLLALKLLSKGFKQFDSFMDPS